METEHRQPMMDPVQRRIQQNDAFVHLPGMRVDAYCFKTGFCGMFQVQRCDDAAGETGIYPVCEDVGTGTNGLCRQLDVYPSEKEQIEYKSPCREICVGIFCAKAPLRMIFLELTDKLCFFYNRGKVEKQEKK